MKKAIALGLVLVLAMSVSALAASVGGSLKFEYDYELNDDWQLSITPGNGIPKTELVLNVKDEGWAFNAEIRRLLEGKDTMQLRQIKANLDEPQVALTIWANGKETADKKDPLEFIKSGKKQDGKNPKYRLEAGVFGVNAVVDYDSKEAFKVEGERLVVTEEGENKGKPTKVYQVTVYGDGGDPVKYYASNKDPDNSEKLYAFIDTNVAGNKVGLAYLANMAEAQEENNDRSRTALVFGEMGFQGATAKVGAGMSFGEGRDADNVLYGVDVKVPIPGYEVVAVQGKWRVAQENAFTTFGSNKRVGELYALYQDSLIKGKAGVKGENKAEYDENKEALTFLAEVTMREKDDGPDFDDVIDDYDELTGYAVKAEVSRLAGKKWGSDGADNPLTRLYLGAGSKFMEGLFGMVELEYKSASKAADHLKADHPFDRYQTVAYVNEDGTPASDPVDVLVAPFPFVPVYYSNYYKLNAEVSYDVGAGVTLIPFASFEKWNDGEKIEWYYDMADQSVEYKWQSVGALGAEVEYALSSNVTLGAKLERSATKWETAPELSEKEDKATTGSVSVKVAF
ncbi:MAG: hypothetical protein ACOYCE_00265 [Limnochordia bacterium]|jgi:hypothetical protein